MNYIYKINISGDRVLYFRELNLEEYKNLQKVCIESDIDIFKRFSSHMINELCVEGDCSNLNMIDIYVILLHIRIYSVSDVKEFNTYINEKQCVVKIKVQDLVFKVLEHYNKYSTDKYLKVNLIDFPIADQVLIDIFNDELVRGFIKGDVIYDDFGDNIDDLIPMSVKIQIDDQTKSIINSFCGIELFRLTDKDGRINIFNFDLNEEYIYNFCKVIFKDNLKSVYENMLDLKRNVNINFDEHKHMTLNEMGMYINMFNKKQESEKNKQPQNNQYPV